MGKQDPVLGNCWSGKTHHTRMFSNLKEETEKKGFHQYAPDSCMRKKLKQVLWPVADNWSIRKLLYP